VKVPRAQSFLFRGAALPSRFAGRRVRRKHLAVVSTHGVARVREGRGKPVRGRDAPRANRPSGGGRWARQGGCLCRVPTFETPSTIYFFGFCHSQSREHDRVGAAPSGSLYALPSGLDGIRRSEDLGTVYSPRSRWSVYTRVRAKLGFQRRRVTIQLAHSCAAARGLRLRARYLTERTIARASVGAVNPSGSYVDPMRAGRLSD